MAKKSAMKNHNQELMLFYRRLGLLTLIIMALLTVLVWRLIHMQVFEGEMYRTLSIKNQFTIVPTTPRRGLIFDRDGVLLAENITTHSLEVIPNKSSDLKKTISAIKQLIVVSEDDETKFWKAVKRRQRFEPILLKPKLSEQEIAVLSVNKYRLPSTMVTAKLERHYPYRDLYAHTLGFVGRINDKEFGQLNPTVYSATNYIGKVGIEKYYEQLLHGRIGYRQMETDASGRVVRMIRRQQHLSGSDIYLTISTGLQQAITKALGHNKGAVVAINPQNGEILAMVSNPSYDPNVFVNGISVPMYNALKNDPSKPLYNRILRGQYPFGSTIKPFYALQGLDLGIVTPELTINDPGYFTLPGINHVWNDWRKHGRVNLEKSIVISCDTYYYRLAVKMGVSNMADILRRFGFGRLTGVDIGEELPGLVPSPKWKLKSQGHKWYLGDTVSAGIGQGYILTTPLQLASATATLAMHGTRYRPHLLKSIRSPDGDLHPVKPDRLPPVVLYDPHHWDLIIHAMENVVKWGTAYVFGNPKPPYTTAAKTGTAQVAGKKHYDHLADHRIPMHMRAHSLFIVFAPVEHPEIALAVIAENNEKLAKRVSRKILDYYLLGKEVDGPPNV